MPPMILDSSLSRSPSSSPDTYYRRINNTSQPFFEDDEESENEEQSEDGDLNKNRYTDHTLFRSTQTTEIYQSIESPDSSGAENEVTETPINDSEGDIRPSLGRSGRKLRKESNVQYHKRQENRAQAEPPTCAKSQYDGYIPPLPICKERVAVEDMLAEIDKSGMKEEENQKSDSSVDGPEFVEFELTNFTIYLPELRFHPFEMRGLQHLTTKNGHGSFLLDGILSAGRVQRCIEAVPFKVCSIGNYDTEFDEVGSNIWIQSDNNAKTDIYYRLGDPSPEYKRYHEGFIWVANLAKHFVDYCMACQTPISVHDFRSNFFNWASKTHEGSTVFLDWHRKYGKSDYRRAVAANIGFLFKESIGVSEELRPHPIWRELLERDFVPQQPIVEEQTIVTPFVYECFKDLKFGHYLKVINPTDFPESRRTQQEISLHLTGHTSLNKVKMPIAVAGSRSQSGGFGMVSKDMIVEIDSRSNATKEHERMLDRQRKVRAIKVGDVLSVTKDGDGSVWKDEVSRWKAADDCWYVYVQGIHVSKRGEKSFDAIWLYKPSDTSCAKMKYPFGNELFLSDNCTCGNDRIKEDEVLDLIPVIWHGDPSDSRRHIVIRQTYLENEKFVTLETSHKQCEHFQARNQEILPKSNYPIGSTVLLRPRQKSNHSLEAYEIVRYFVDDRKPCVVLRRLIRRTEVDGSGRPNELVYTTQMDKYPVGHIEQRCLVRFYTEYEIENRVVPAPYSRDGSGNAFYIATALIKNDGVHCLRSIQEELPESLIQGFDPLAPLNRKLLRGMDLYCGGGNFGRGLEEGGAVRNEWAVDINKNAIHTYSANLRGPDDEVKLFFGSVNDMLSQAMKGNPKNSRLIPMPGDVDFISAGSPCQGFSILNSDRNNEKGLKNQSLVASVASYIDFYRPKYGILENVMTMAQKGRGRDEDVLSQLMCAIVGMGYQAQLFVVDAWSCGSPQSRSRLFVSFAAPGLVPLEHPAISHSHPASVRDRGLGQLANGQAFGRRMHVRTPFKYVSAGEATNDLPSIGDGFTYHCIQQPDHVMGKSVIGDMRMQIEAIPTYPRGMCFAKAWNEGNGMMTPEQRSLFLSYTKTGKIRENQGTNSNAWGRVNPHGLFPTIVVTLTASDSRTGYCLHWDEPRYLTTMEARRAQGFPDDEIIVGSSVEGWKLMGNSVARTVSMALGLALREAWLMNGLDDDMDLRLFTTSDNVKTPVRSYVNAERSCASSLNHTPSNNRQQNMLNMTSSEQLIDENSHRSRPIVNGLTSQNPEVGLVYKSQRNLVVPNSTGASGDEGNMASETVDSVSSTLLVRTETRVEKPTINPNNGNIISRKRAHGAMQETRAMPIEKTHKFPKVTSHYSPQSASRPSSSNGSTLMTTEGIKRQQVNHSTFDQKTTKVKQNNIQQEKNQLFRGLDDDSNTEDEYISTALSSFNSLMRTDQFRSDIVASSSSRRAKSPSNPIDKSLAPPQSRIQTPQSKAKVVISLLSDDEDEEPVASPVLKPAYAPKKPDTLVQSATQRLIVPPENKNGLLKIKENSLPIVQQSQLRSASSMLSTSPPAPSKSTSSLIPQTRVDDPVTNMSVLPATASESNPILMLAKTTYKAQKISTPSVMNQSFKNLVNRIAQQPVKPPTKRYLPVENNEMIAYALTNQYLKLDKRRKHGPRT